MSGVAMAGPAPHGSGMTTPMPDGCKDCDGAKGGSGCTMMACATAIGVLADLLRVDPRPASSPVPVRDTAIIGLVTDPDHLPPRR